MKTLTRGLRAALALAALPSLRRLRHAGHPHLARPAGGGPLWPLERRGQPHGGRRHGAPELPGRDRPELGACSTCRPHGGRRPTLIVGTVRNRSMEHIPVETFVRDLERALPGQRAGAGRGQRRRARRRCATSAPTSRTTPRADTPRPHGPRAGRAVHAAGRHQPDQRPRGRPPRGLLPGGHDAGGPGERTRRPGPGSTRSRSSWSSPASACKPPAPTRSRR